MSFRQFVNASGLKVLAMTQLSQGEYSLVLYLLNCAASGLDELVTNFRELSSLMGYDVETIQRCVYSLAEKNIIRIRHADLATIPNDRLSVRIGLNYEMSTWTINKDSDLDSKDAIVFPFRRGQNLQLIDGTKPDEPIVEIIKPQSSLPTWRRVLNAFELVESLNSEELAQAEADAKILTETHPTDQVLLMLRHFGARIPTLSLLASSWQHYQEVYEEETQRVDISEARLKHHELDNKLREKVEEHLAKKQELELSEEEIAVLEILFSHRHPRRQLFWAFQARSRYPKLKEFFDENAKHMLSITSTGAVVKKKN